MMRILTLFLTALLTAAAATAQVVQPTNHLARARAYLEAGREDLALAHARRAADAPNASVEAFLLLGLLLERRADREGAIASFCRAALRDPESEATQQRLARVLAEGYPARIDDALFAALPGETVAGELTFRDGRLGREASPIRRWRSLAVPAGSVRTAIDPKYRRPYARVHYAYAQLDQPARWFRVAAVHYQKSSDEALARRVAGLLAQLFWTRREYWSTVPDFPKPPEAEVWLSREGDAGGEEWRGRIYLYEVGRVRSPEEWVRQVTHEFGHTALPDEPVYREPEPHSSGYLGELLLIGWLAKSRAALWEGAVDPARYLARRARPLRARFLREGPHSPLLGRRDRAGMDQYIGMVLAWEATYGPRLLRAAFDRMLGKNAESFLLGCQEAMSAALPPRLEIARDALLTPEGRENAAGSAVWVYLPAGTWSLSVEVSGGAPVSARWDGRPLSRLGTRAPKASYGVTLARDGWHRLSVVGPPLRVTRIALDRIDSRLSLAGYGRSPVRP